MSNARHARAFLHPTPMPSLGSLIAKVSLDYAEFELGADRSSQAALKMGNDIERAVTRAMGSYKKSVGDMSAANDDLGASMARASAGAAALAESEDQAAARIRDMVARSLEAQQGLQQVASASQSAADGIGAVGASADQVRANVAAQTQAMIAAQRATVLMNDEMQALRTTMAQGNATFATLGDQYSRLDRAMATGKLSMQEYDAALAALGKDEDKRVQALNALTSKYDPLGSATRKLAADQALLDDAYKSGQVTTAQYQQALAGIKADQAVVELRRLADQEAQLERALKSGTVSSADYKKALADIGTNRSALTDVASAADKTGKSMEGFGLKTAGARKEVVVLAHEMLTGNWSNFGGSVMVLAERMDLMEVATSATGLAIAAIAAPIIAVGAAMVMVSHQNEAMNDALVLTGNYAGTTVDGLRSMAEAATAGGASFNTAADAVTQLAATGRLTGEEISGLGQTTADVATYTSMSVKQMVDEFTKLAEDPVKASVKLNDTYHYLTASTYDQIVALEKQGDATGAAQIAVETFSKAMDDRTKDIAANEGTILQGWRDIKNMINGAIEAVGMFGATATPGQVVGQLQARKAAWTPNGTWSADDEAELQKAIAAYEKAKKDAHDKAVKDRQEQEVIDAKHSYDTWNSQFATPAEKRAKEIQTYIDTIATPLNLSADQQLADEQKINDKYKDKKTSSSRSAGLIDKTQLQGEVQAIKDSLDQELSYVKSAQTQLDALYKSGGIGENAYYSQTRDNIVKTASERAKAFDDEAAILAKGLTNHKLNAAQHATLQKQIDDLHAKSAAAIESGMLGIADSAGKEQAAIDKVNQSFLDSIDKQTAAAEQQDQTLQDQIDTFGMTKAAIDNLRAARADEAVATMEADRAERLRNDDMADTKVIDARIEKEKQLAAALHGVASDQTKLDDDQQLKKQQDDVVKSWQSTIDGIGTDFHNGFLQMLTNGKNGWDSFTKSLVNTFETTVVNELYKAFAQKWVINVVANIAGLVGGSDIQNQILQNNGMASSALGGMNNLSTGYSALTKGYGYLQGLLGVGYGSAGSAIGGAAGAFGASTAGAFGALSTTGGAAAAAAESGALSSSAALGGLYGSTTAGVGAAASGIGGGSAAASSGAAGAGLTGAASSMGWVPVVGWILAGMALDAKMMGQGWNPDNGSISGVGKGIGSASLASYDLAKAVGIPSGIANILTGASTISRLFGRKDPTVDSAGVEGTVTVANGFQGQDFADWTAKGGLFRSDAHGTQHSPATQEQIDLINGTVVGTVAVVNQLGNAIGGIDGLQGKLSAFNYSIRNDWRDQTNITKSLTDLSNNLVDQLVPLDKYQQTGETLTQTAVRLTGVFTATNTLADMLGKTMTQAFGAVGLAGADARLNLIAAAGGIDNFKSEVSAYFSAYYSSSEQLKSAQDQMAASFSSLGLAMPQSKDAFRALVGSLDLTTAAGQSAFATMMALAPSFDQLSQAMQKAADAEQSLWNQYFSAVYTPAQQLAMNTKQLKDQFDALGVAMPKTNADFQALVENIDPSSAAAKQLQDSLLALAPAFGQVMSAADQAAQAAQQAADQAAQAAAQTLQTALSNVQTAYSSQVQAINANITSISNFVTSLTNLKQSLSLGSLSTLSPQDKYLAEKQLFDTTSAKAAAGDATAQGNLPQVAQDFLTASQAYNASSQAYVDDYNAVQKSLDANIATAQQQLSAAQQQLNATNQMVQGILNLNSTAMSLSDALKAYFAAGGTTSAAAGAAAANTYGGAAGGNLNRSQVEATAVNGLIPYSAANPYGPMGGYSVADWQASNSAGVSDATKAALGMTQGPDGTYGWYANGSHAGGLDSVPFDGYRAELHKGEAVVTSANNQKLSQMLNIDWSRFENSDQAALVNEVKALRAEVAAAREERKQIAALMLQQGQQQHAENRADMSKQTRHLQNTSDNTGKIANKR
ncbi:phage tail length tape measure family protein [Paraburkholderia sediminicola]|uniref:Phage tail length tape measure family protein n=1 Tax=Paraburkholderia rhynchosiae TaxID=487049 RepID=A0ACC7NAK2_9BURK